VIKSWMVAVGAAVALSGCGGRNIPGFPKGDGVGISFSSPSDGATISSSSVWLSVHTTGVTLDGAAIGGPDVDGHGHYHVYVDGNAVGNTADTKYLVTNLLPGSHEISARLFQNDEQPIPGSSSAQVTVVIPADAPRVHVVNPGAGAINSASAAEMTLDWQNFTPGYWWAYVDSLDAPVSTISDNPTSVVPRLAPGWHDVYVSLHHGGPTGGEEYDPPVIDRIRIEVPDDAPAATITSPADGATTNRTPTIHVEVKNFVVDGNLAGGAPQPGIGHYHVYVDGYDSGHMWQEGYAADTVLDNIPVGEHDVYVRLMNNDHTSIEPKPVDRIHLTVTQ
jgi:hypothetical protein